MSYYPVYLDLRERPCLVTGEGHEMDPKVEGFLAAGAKVTVVTPTPSPFLRDLASQRRIVLHQRRHQAGDLARMFLAVAATTEDLDLSGLIAQEAERERVLLNVVDVTPLCIWIAPAIVRRGEVTVAISTNATSPAMARFVKNRVSEALEREEAMVASPGAEAPRGPGRRKPRPGPKP